MADRSGLAAFAETLATLATLAPAAFLGALTTLAHAGKPTTWWMALKAISVGTITATFVCSLLVEVFGWRLTVAMAVAYLIGLVAYRVTPILLRGSEQVAGAAPAIVIDRLKALWPSKKAPASNDAEAQP